MYKVPSMIFAPKSDSELRNVVLGYTGKSFLSIIVQQDKRGYKSYEREQM